MLHLLSARRVALALVLGMSAYAWWVSAQYSQLNALNQLELQDAGAELKRVVENAVVTINTFKPDKDASAGQTQAPACVFDDQQPYLDFVGDCAAETWKYQKATATTAQGLRIQAERVTTAGPSATVEWKVRLDTLFAELAFSDAFELIFVADEAGKVLYQNTPRQREWRQLLRWGERTFEDTGARESGGLRIQDMPSLLGKDAVPGWGRLHAVSDRTTVSLGGQSQQLYVQPVGGENGISVRLVLGALVPTQRVVRQALAVDTYFVALLVVVLLLALLGLPFLKLASMSAHERFQVRDVYALYLSCAALVTVATFIVMGYDTYLRWTREADTGLLAMADDLEARVTTEVRDIRDQLAGYDAAVSWYAPNSPCTTARVMAPWPELDPAADPEGRVLTRNTTLFMDQVTWIDPTGQQVWKLSSDQIGVLRRVPQRPYFKAVRGGHLYRDATSPWPFFVAPDRSITDGRFYTFLSIPSMLDDACVSVPRHVGPGQETVPASGYVAVASTRLLSTEHAALPQGYGFAIVTRDGRALYHSDSRLGLRANFFDHLDEEDLARAIAQSGRKASLSARYREVPHRLQFNPLPWSLDDALDGTPEHTTPGDGSAGVILVAFRDVSTEQAVVARAFVVSLGPMLLLVAAVGLGLWAVGAVSERCHGGASRWLWPHGGLAPMYKILAISVGVVIILFAVTTEWLTRAWPYLLLPAFAAVPGLAAYGRGSWHTAPRRALDSYAWYTGELTLLALGMLVVPASAVVNLTLGHEFGVLIHAEQRRMDDQATDAALALKAEAHALSYPDRVGDEIADAHRRRQRQIDPLASPRRLSQRFRPAPFDASLAPLSAGDQRVVGVHEWLNNRLPAESALLARLRYYDVPRRYTPQGSLGALSGFGAAGITLIIVVLAVWIRWSARNLHAADLTPATPALDAEVEARWNELPEDHRHVLLQATEERIANPRQRPAIDALARQGLLTLSPDIQPASGAVAALLAGVRADGQQAEKLRQWEGTHDGHSWQAVRPMLFVGLGVVAVFLVITQPGLQSDLVGVAGSAATLGAALLKMRDAIGGWMGVKAGASPT